MKKNNVWLQAKGVLIGSLLVVMLLLLLFPTYISGLVYEEKAQRLTADEYSSSLAKVCDYGDSDDKIHCVYLHVLKYFKYVSGAKNIFQVNMPTATIEDGGNCLDWSMLYCSVFKQMEGLKCSVMGIDDPNHAFSIVRYGDGYCILDQTILDCPI